MQFACLNEEQESDRLISWVESCVVRVRRIFRTAREKIRIAFERLSPGRDSKEQVVRGIAFAKLDDE